MRKRPDKYDKILTTALICLMLLLVVIMLARSETARAIVPEPTPEIVTVTVVKEVPVEVPVEHIVEHYTVLTAEEAEQMGPPQEPSGSGSCGERTSHETFELSGATGKRSCEVGEDEVYALAKAVQGEAGGCSKTQQAAVVWAVLNMTETPGFAPDILGNLTYPNRVMGYYTTLKPTEEHLSLVRDVLARWELEKLGVGEVGRVLPRDYTFWEGDGKINHFRNAYRRSEATIWDWSWGNPYGE